VQCTWLSPRESVTNCQLGSSDGRDGMHVMSDISRGKGGGVREVREVRMEFG